MSRCQHCLQGFCKRHPLQDHGERAALLSQKLKEHQSSKFNPHEIIQAEIERLSRQSKGTLCTENDDYKSALQADRHKALKASDGQKVQKPTSLSGLNPSVSSIMMTNYDSDKEEKHKKHKKRKHDSDQDSDESEDSSSSDTDEVKKDEAKKIKKSKKEKKEKKEKKKEHKKRKKHKSEKKRSSREESSESGHSRS